MALVLSGAGVAGADEGRNARKEAQLHLKVLSYDRNLKERSGDNVVIAVVYRAGAEASRRDRDQMLGAFKDAAKRIDVQEMTPSVVAVAWDDEAGPKQMARLGVTVVYVARGVDDDARDVGMNLDPRVVSLAQVIER